MNHQVSDAEQVRKTIAEVVDAFGKIDVFVANAGNTKHIGNTRLVIY